jgi:hypothetical protein
VLASGAGPVLRWVVEIAVFGAAAVGLVCVGRTRLALLLVVLYAANQVWDQ